MTYVKLDASGDAPANLETVLTPQPVIDIRVVIYVCPILLRIAAIYADPAIYMTNFLIGVDGPSTSDGIGITQDLKWATAELGGAIPGSPDVTPGLHTIDFHYDFPGLTFTADIDEAGPIDLSGAYGFMLDTYNVLSVLLTMNTIGAGPDAGVIGNVGWYDQVKIGTTGEGTDDILLDDFDGDLSNWTGPNTNGSSSIEGGVSCDQPALMSIPTITGTPWTGRTLTVVPGEYNPPRPPEDLSYQWKSADDGLGTGAGDIGGEVATTYVIDPGQLGKFIAVEETAATI